MELAWQSHKYLDPRSCYYTEFAPPRIIVCAPREKKPNLVGNGDKAELYLFGDSKFNQMDHFIIPRPFCTQKTFTGIEINPRAELIIRNM
jgi:hypothetical protein